MGAPNKTMVVLAASLGGALMVIAFLLGRETRPAPAPVLLAAPQPVRIAPTPPPAAAVAQPPPIAPPPASGASPSEVAAVRQYFAAVDGLQVGPEGADSKGFAQGMLASAMSGDFSAFDGLVADANTSLAKARAIAPPEPCREHHGKLVALMSESTVMLAKQRDALKNKNADSLTGLMSSAQGMQERATALQASEQALRQRYGI